MQDMNVREVVRYFYEKAPKPKNGQLFSSTGLSMCDLAFYYLYLGDQQDYWIEAHVLKGKYGIERFLMNKFCKTCRLKLIAFGICLCADGKLPKQEKEFVSRYTKENDDQHDHVGEVREAIDRFRENYPKLAKNYPAKLSKEQLKYGVVGDGKKRNEGDQIDLNLFR